MQGRRFPLRSRTTWLGITTLGLFAGLVALRWPVVEGPFAYVGEAREAECIADVVRHGNWIAPFPNRDWVPTKGPLLYWWAGLFTSIFGLSETVIRLSQAALALGTILATASIGRLLAGSRAGWLAAASLTTCLLFFDYTLYLRVDMGLCFCVSLTLLAFVWGLVRPERRALAFFLGQMALAAALFAKGLSALIPIGGVVMGTLVLRADWLGIWSWVTPLVLLLALALSPQVLPFAALLGAAPWLLRLRRRSAELPGAGTLVSGLLLVAVLFAWLKLADARYPCPYLDFVIEDSTSRVANARGTDPFYRPFYWYLPRFLLNAFPWALFLPAACVWVGAGVSRERRDPRWVPLLWAVFGLVAFSAFSYKRLVYLLPLLPAVGLLVGLLFDGSAFPKHARLRVRWLTASYAVLASAGGVLAVLGISDALLRLLRGSGWIPEAADSRVVVALREGAALVDPLLGLAGALWIAAGLLWRRKGSYAFAAVLAGQAVVLLGASLVVVPMQRLRPESPVRLAEEIRRLVPPGAELRFAPGVRDHGLLYYVDRRVVPTFSDEVEGVLSGPSATELYFVARDASFLPGGARSRAEVLAEGAGSQGRFVLLRWKRPDREATPAGARTRGPGERLAPDPDKTSDSRRRRGDERCGLKLRHRRFEE